MNTESYAYGFGQDMAEHWSFTHALDTIPFSTLEDHEVDDFIRGFADYRDRWTCLV